MVKLFGRKNKNDRVELTVRGMTCGHCEMRVAKALKQVPGVLEAEADREREQAIIVVDASQVPAAADLVAAVQAAGYEAEAPAS